MIFSVDAFCCLISGLNMSNDNDILGIIICKKKYNINYFSSFILIIIFLDNIVYLIFVLELLIKQFDAIILIHIAVIHIYRRLFHVI